MSIFEYSILIINSLWFLGGFKTFAITSKQTVRMFRPDLPNDDPQTVLVTPSIKFLGGMNLALLCLNLGALYFLRLNMNPELFILTLLTSGLAHGTQFAYNIPHIKGLKNGAPWDVLKMPMLFIFVVDFLTMVINIIGLI